MKPIHCLEHILIALLGGDMLAAGNPAWAASMQVFPASHRPDRTLYLIEDEVMPIFFHLSSDNAGIAKLPALPPNFAGEIILAFDLPKEIHYFGANELFADDGQFSQRDRSEEITRDGTPYIRHHVTLDTKRVVARVWKDDYYTVKVWVRPPRVARATFSWKLLRDAEILAESSNPIRTLGPIPAGATLPKDFILWIWNYDRSIPDAVMDARLALYKKIGVTHFGFNYRPPSEQYVRGLTPRQLEEAQKVKGAGIKLAAERIESFNFSTYFGDPAKREKALVQGSADCVKGILNDREKAYLANVVDLADTFFWDYEPNGPEYFHVFEDARTMAAFAKSKGIQGEVTPQTVRGAQAQAYTAYCQDLLSAPVQALADLVRVVKPGLRLALCQGNGFPIGDHVDPKRYDAAVDYHMPMIYTDPFAFCDKVQTTAEYLGPQKLIPVTSCGYHLFLWRPRPGGVLLDYLATASCGAPGLAHWPGIEMMGAEALYDLYRAGKMLAPVEAIYRKGARAQDITARGLCYFEKKISVAGKVLDLSQPYWKFSLVVRTHAHQGERLVTILNCHPDEAVFVQVQSGTLKGNHCLINPGDGVCLTVKGQRRIPAAVFAKGVLVRTGPMAAGLWLVTDKADQAARLQPLAMEDLAREYDARCKEYTRDQGTAMELGKKGALVIDYDAVPTEGGQDNDICLRVASPSQTLYFTDIGGKIWKWEVGGVDLVERQGHKLSGVGMDLFWVPAHARWSGDQLRPMQLRQCRNSSAEVKLVYTGELKTAIPGLMIEKTYTIPADQPLVKVKVRYQNDTPMTVTLSHWSHNWFKAPPGNERRLVVLRPGGVAMPAYNEPGFSTRIYLNDAVAKDCRQYVMAANPKAIEPSYGAFGEYFTQARMGVLFRLPPDFFQIYRYEGAQDATLEWMHRPVALRSGEAEELAYQMNVVTGVTLPEFGDRVKAVK